ncbi:hypothetical protein ABZ468_07250 [Streptomyces sp. NPDC005708]|uniref:hypothetical protein n=1 Tax=Streptomyces sp. NPDC005708 TaxID=3154564 RepID=UPI0033C171F5
MHAQDVHARLEVTERQLPVKGLPAGDDKVGGVVSADGNGDHRRLGTRHGPVGARRLGVQVDDGLA